MSAPVVDPTTGEVLGDRGGAGDAFDELPHEELLRLAKAYRHQAQGLQKDVEGLEREARNYRRKIKALEDELKEQRQEAPEGQTVRTIFNAWVKATGRNPKTTKLGPAREKAVLARLREGHSDNRVLRAATVGVRGANTSNRESEREALIAVMHRAVEMVEPHQADELRAEYVRLRGKAKVYDDLELICRNEVNLERFADMADRFDPPRAVTVEEGE